MQMCAGLDDDCLIVASRLGRQCLLSFQHPDKHSRLSGHALKAHEGRRKVIDVPEKLTMNILSLGVIPKVHLSMVRFRQIRNKGVITVLSASLFFTQVLKPLSLRLEVESGREEAGGHAASGPTATTAYG